MSWIATLALFLLTALAEIVGCYLMLLWAKRGACFWVLGGATFCLAFFAWLLTWHPAGSGRVCAAHGGVYTCSALAWLWVVDRVTPAAFDVVGISMINAGCIVVIAGSVR